MTRATVSPAPLPPATPKAAGRALWAGIGTLCLAAQSWVAAVWITRGGLHAVPSSGLDLSDAPRVIGWAMQAAMAVLVLLVVLHAIRDCVRARTVTVAAALAAGYLLAAWTDVLVNYARPAFVYNRSLINVATWGPAIPGWHSPQPQWQAEPILVVGFGFLAAAVLAHATAAVAAITLQRFRLRGPVPTYLTCALAGALIDTAVEMLWIRSGAFAYPYAIREVSLFAGHWYQFPLTHPLLIGTTFIGPAALLLCRHRQGHLTILSPHPVRHGMVTLLAGVGIVTAMILAFSAATVALSLHGGPPPPDLPSYLRLPTGGA
ncbi:MULTISPECIES: spirocyclase AveC family protein [unclassified Nonomuraea]|uniref:spirocyclase AveC family protein n=1 Tax=unclassified Nonomuraea TaxID=2593643 RepID=UPI003410E636